MVCLYSLYRVLSAFDLGVGGWLRAIALLAVTVSAKSSSAVRGIGCPAPVCLLRRRRERAVLLENWNLRQRLPPSFPSPVLTAQSSSHSHTLSNSQPNPPKLTPLPHRRKILRRLPGHTNRNSNHRLLALIRQSARHDREDGEEG